MGLWYWITEEFKALGFRCVAHGPEFWLVAPAALGLISGTIAIVRQILRRDKK